MKTTRALLFALGGLITLGLVAFALLNLSLPVAELFEYSAGTIVTFGLLSMLLAGDGATERPLTPPSEQKRRPRRERCCPPARHDFAHAA